MACPLCYVPPAVCAAWSGGAALSTQGPRAAEAGAALGVTGALPLAYLGVRRLRGSRPAMGAACLVTAVAASAVCIPRLTAAATTSVLSEAMPRTAAEPAQAA
eukprot:gnl/TRDRNA2_/TRDRNA2_188594_c0_seq1.p1 gnl/TRDRNA2_/TRDRNA2_188594_c0~~gnl/TRDRNA2_/TRDRNA2_188594_c0_seq1.p1  ORF type:complete len:103 (+),score=10.53 gnl/TRDRNA2_/TRDRNA2_188594_c0_seq1:82-390(+)